MALSIKELLIVLVIASLVFWLAKPIVLTFTPALDLKRRRRAWFALTILAFLTPSFWIFTAFAIPILIVTGRRDSNPTAVYLLLLHVIPPAGVEVPMVGMSYLFVLDSFLLLSLCLFTPAAIRMLRAPERPRYRALRWMDLALLGYGLLNSFHYLQVQGVDGVLYPPTITDSIRRVFVFLFITYIPYFVTSRSSVNRSALLDNMASYCLASGLLAAIAIFESLRSWLLYGEMTMRWGINTGAGYLTRENALRAMASAGHPLTLATLLSIAVALWLYLRPRVESANARLGFAILLSAGLFVTYSRGPWIGAAVSGLVFLMLKPRAVSTIFKTTIGVLLVGTALSVTPFGKRLISLMPIFGGKADSDTIIYRENLMDRSLTLIGQHPFIGDTTAFSHMETLRQGQGIIDLVNVYIQVLLNDGFVGLTLLLGFLLLGVAKVNAVRRRSMQSDPDTAILGASLMGCTAGFLVTLGGGSFGTGTERMFYILAGFLAGYAMNGGIQPSVRTPRRELQSTSPTALG